MNWQLGLNFYSHGVIFFNPADLTDENVAKAIKTNKYHIYLVCKRKKIHIADTEKDGESEGKSTLFYLDDNLDKQYIYVKHPYFIKGYKDGIYKIYYRGEEVDIHENLFINNLFFLENDVIGDKVSAPLLSDLEVMYIGQAFGRKQRKQIDYRVGKHEKIQQIAIEIANKGTNEQVLIIGVTVKVNDLATSVVNVEKHKKLFTMKDLLALKNKASKRISEGQEITVYEASLIRYFQPQLIPIRH